MRSLIQNDVKIHRRYFNEALEAYGVDALYYQVKPGKKFTSIGELSANYYAPTEGKVIFDQTPQLRTLKKLGWVSELDQTLPLLHVSFDLPGIETGCLFKIKDPLQFSGGRLFRITKMSVGIISPASITVQAVPIAGTEPSETVKPYDGVKSVFLNKPEGID